MNRLGFVLLTIELGVGCASVSPERGHDKVSSIVSERTGHKTRWEKGPPDQTEIADWVRKVTAAGLTRDRAVEIALVNNPSLQATYEDLGVSQADMVQAGLLRNPAFGLDLGFRINNGQRNELRVSLVQDFLDLFVLPLRKEIAREQFEADTLNVANRALEVAADVEKAFVVTQADARSWRPPQPRQTCRRGNRRPETSASWIGRPRVRTTSRRSWISPGRRSTCLRRANG